MALAFETWKFSVVRSRSICAMAAKMLRMKLVAQPPFSLVSTPCRTATK